VSDAKTWTSGLDPASREVVAYGLSEDMGRYLEAGNRLTGKGLTSAAARQYLAADALAAALVELGFEDVARDGWKQRTGVEWRAVPGEASEWAFVAGEEVGE
jgi:hypothetical protein